MPSRLATTARRDGLGACTASASCARPHILESSRSSAMRRAFLSTPAVQGEYHLINILRLMVCWPDPSALRVGAFQAPSFPVFDLSGLPEGFYHRHTLCMGMSDHVSCI